MFSLVFYLVTPFSALRICNVHDRGMEINMGRFRYDIDRGSKKYSEINLKKPHLTFKLPEVEVDHHK
jgi:hypothetical protein